MKLTVRCSNTGVLAIIGLAIAILLATDIFTRPRTVSAPVASSDKVVAKEFCLTDDNGRTRARIAMNEYGAPCLQLFDKQGQTRAQLRLNKSDVPSLRLYDAAGRARSITGFTLDDMQPSLVMFDENGNGRLAANPDSPSINGKSICDEDRTWKRANPLSPYFAGSDTTVTLENGQDLYIRDIQAQNAQLEAEKARMEAEIEQQQALAKAQEQEARDQAERARQQEMNVRIKLLGR